MLWYSLEAPRRGASNEYHNICFRGEIKEIKRKRSILLWLKKKHYLELWATVLAEWQTMKILMLLRIWAVPYSPDKKFAPNFRANRVFQSTLCWWKIYIIRIDETQTSLRTTYYIFSLMFSHSIALMQAFSKKRRILNINISNCVIRPHSGFIFVNDI